MRPSFILCTVWIGFVACPTSVLAAEVNYSEHVATIIYEHCSQCHRPGQSAPFTLLSYDDVKKNADTIQQVINSRYMPPWKPVAASVTYANNRQLPENQIKTLNAWIEAGCPEGNSKLAPNPPQYPDVWALGKPDLVIRMEESFRVPAEGPDLYRSFVLPTNLPEDKWVKAIELRPQARGAVHHALFFLDESGASRAQNKKDGQTGIRGMNFFRGQGADALQEGPDRMARGLGGYVPGATPNRLPGDLARLLPKGSDIIMQTHFHPTGKVEIEQAELALYFTDQPPSHKLVPIQLPPMFGMGLVWISRRVNRTLSCKMNSLFRLMSKASKSVGMPITSAARWSLWPPYLINPP